MPVFNLKLYDGPPYQFRVRVNGKYRIMSGFDEEHIKEQLKPLEAKSIKQMKETW